MTPDGLNFLAEGILKSSCSGPEVFTAVAEWSLKMATAGAERFENEVVSYIPVSVVEDLRAAIRGRLGYTARMTLETWAIQFDATVLDFDANIDSHYEIMTALAGAAEA